MGNGMMFSREPWIEPVRTNYRQVRGGVKKVWRKSIDEEMMEGFLPGKRIDWKVRLEVQEERIRQQLMADMKADKNLSDDQQKHIMEQADIFIPLTRNLTAFKDILDEQLRGSNMSQSTP